MKFLRSLFLSLSLVLLTVNAVRAQSAPQNPAFTYGMVPTAGQWNNWFQQKQDNLGFVPFNRNGGTFLGPLQLFASTTSATGLNIGVGNAPSLPNPGDFWATSSGLYYQSNISTIGPLGGGSITSITCLGTTITTSGSCGALTGDVTSPSSTGVTTLAKISGITAHYIPIGEGSLALGSINTSTSACIVQGQGASSDPLCNAMSGQATIAANGALSLATNTVTYSNDAQSAANTVSGNPTGATANRQDVVVPTCNGATSGLNYTGGGGASAWTCNNSLGPVVGYRNRLINGDFRVSQRNGGSSSTSTTTAPGVYGGPDRWYSLSTGAAVTVQQVAGTFPAQYAYQVTGAASNTGTEVGQRIEATNIYDLASQTVTFQAGIKCSALTSVTWTAYYPASSDTWTSRTQIATGTFTVTSSYATYSTQISLPSNVTTGLEIALSTGAMVSGTCTYQYLQLEGGSVATAFEKLPVQDELVLCQRYFINNLQVVLASYSGVTSVSAGASTTYLPMRTTPTGTLGTANNSGAIGATNSFNSITATTTAVVGTTSGTGAYFMNQIFSLSAEL